MPRSLAGMRRSQQPRSARSPSDAVRAASNDEAGALATWDALREQWGQEQESPRFRDVLRVKEQQLPSVLASVAPRAEAIVAELPDFYATRIRPAARYLFTNWMPVGYACMLALDDTEMLRKATEAVLSYGAAVTVLDDVADTEAFDDVLGPGSADEIARVALEYAQDRNFVGMPDVSDNLRPVVEFVVDNTDRLLSYVQAHDEERRLEHEFRELLRALIEGVVECRRVRRAMERDEAGPRDLDKLGRVTPHGMTVGVVGLVGFAHCCCELSLAEVRRDLLSAQVACHFANGRATLDRELAHHDPSNPIVLTAIKRGDVDGAQYVRGEIDETQLRTRLDDPRKLIERDTASRLSELDGRRLHYRTMGGERFLESFLFGLRSLSKLYTLAFGRV